jgi:hypothetical protein
LFTLKRHKVMASAESGNPGAKPGWRAADTVEGFTASENVVACSREPEVAVTVTVVVTG